MSAPPAFRPNEIMLRQIFDYAVVGIFQSSPDGRNLLSNHAFAEILGYQSPEEVRETITDIARQFYVDPDRRRQVSEMIASGGGRLDECESQVRRKDGRVIWISENTRVALDPETGRAVYLGCIADVTARKEVELALGESEARLRREMTRRRQAEAALESAMKQALLVCDADGNLDFCSDRAARLLRDHYGLLHPPAALPPALRAALEDASPYDAPPGGTADSPLGGLVIRAANGSAGQGVRAFSLEEPFRCRLVACLLARGLTARESEVLFWVSQAKTNPEIAALIGVAEKTVKKHLQHIYAKLGVENRTAAVLRASEWLERPGSEVSPG